MTRIRLLPCASLRRAIFRERVGNYRSDMASEGRVARTPIRCLNGQTALGVGTIDDDELCTQ